jgi:hypothetical protein
MTGPVGPRGLTVLLIVGIIGLALAVCMTGVRHQRLVLRN